MIANWSKLANTSQKKKKTNKVAEMVARIFSQFI